MMKNSILPIRLQEANMKVLYHKKELKRMNYGWQLESAEVRRRKKLWDQNTLYYSKS